MCTLVQDAGSVQPVDRMGLVAAQIGLRLNRSLQAGKTSWFTIRLLLGQFNAFLLDFQLVLQILTKYVVWDERNMH